MFQNQCVYRCLLITIVWMSLSVAATVRGTAWLRLSSILMAVLCLQQTFWRALNQSWDLSRRVITCKSGSSQNCYVGKICFQLSFPSFMFPFQIPTTKARLPTEICISLLKKNVSFHHPHHPPPSKINHCLPTPLHSLGFTTTWADKEVEMGKDESRLRGERVID